MTENKQYLFNGIKSLICVPFNNATNMEHARFNLGNEQTIYPKSIFIDTVDQQTHSRDYFGDIFPVFGIGSIVSSYSIFGKTSLKIKKNYVPDTHSTCIDILATIDISATKYDFILTQDNISEYMEEYPIRQNAFGYPYLYREYVNPTTTRIYKNIKLSIKAPSTDDMLDKLRKQIEIKRSKEMGNYLDQNILDHKIDIAIETPNTEDDVRMIIDSSYITDDDCCGHYLIDNGVFCYDKIHCINE